MSSPYSAEQLSVLAVRGAFKKGGYKAALEGCFTIRDKGANLHLIKINDAQEILIEEIERQMKDRGYARIIILKARQLGFSTLSQGIGLVEGFRRTNIEGMCVAHEAKSVENIFGMYERAISHENWPYGKLSHDKEQSGEEIIFASPVRSKFRVATANNVGSGRGSTFQYLHLSELAFYRDPSTLLLGLMQGVTDDGSIVIVESTANGWGNYFHTMWSLAEEGKSEYAPLFFPWFTDQNYRIAFRNLVERERFAASMSRKERDTQMEHDLDLEQMNWRRRTVINKCEGSEDKFQQEYPATPDEAFLLSGRSVWDKGNLQRYMMAARKDPPISKGYLIDNQYVPDDEGHIHIWEEPDPTDLYVIGIDTAEGRVRTQGAAGLTMTDGDNPDFNAASVKSVRTGKQVASYKSNYASGLYGEEMVWLGKFYGTARGCDDDAFMVPESNGIGHALVEKLVELGYQRLYVRKTWNGIEGKFQQKFGFATTVETRPILIRKLQDQIRLQECGVRCMRTWNHIASMRYNHAGKAEAPAGSHDDLAFAEMLAIHGIELLSEVAPDQVDDVKRKSPEERLSEFADRHEDQMASESEGQGEAWDEFVF